MWVLIDILKAPFNLLVTNHFAVNPKPSVDLRYPAQLLIGTYSAVEGKLSVVQFGCSSWTRFTFQTQHMVDWCQSSISMTTNALLFYFIWAETYNLLNITTCCYCFCYYCRVNGELNGCWHWCYIFEFLLSLQNHFTEQHTTLYSILIYSNIRESFFKSCCVHAGN